VNISYLFAERFWKGAEVDHILNFPKTLHRREVFTLSFIHQAKGLECGFRGGKAAVLRRAHPREG
jgi:hypothetical protein